MVDLQCSQVPHTEVVDVYDILIHVLDYALSLTLTQMQRSCTLALLCVIRSNKKICGSTYMTTLYKKHNDNVIVSFVHVRDPRHVPYRNVAR